MPFRENPPDKVLNHRFLRIGALQPCICAIDMSALHCIEVLGRLEAIRIDSWEAQVAG